MSLLKNWPCQYPGRGAEDDGAISSRERRSMEMARAREEGATVHYGGEGWWSARARRLAELAGMAHCGAEGNGTLWRRGEHGGARVAELAGTTTTSGMVGAHGMRWRRWHEGEKVVGDGVKK